MPQTSGSQEQRHDDSPIGTWALLCIIGAAMTAGWLFLYFGVFLPRGIVH